MVNLITLATADVDLALFPPFSFVSMPRVNFFPVTSALYIYRVHDRGCTCTIAKPKKHWLHFLHRRPVDPYASRRYHGIRIHILIPSFGNNGGTASCRRFIFTQFHAPVHRDPTTSRVHSPAAFAPKLPFEIVSALYSSLQRIPSLFFVPSLYPLFFFLSLGSSPRERKLRCRS